MPVKTLDHFSTQTYTQYVHILDKIADSKSKLFFCLLYLLPAGCRIGHHMRGTGTKWHFNVMPLYLHTGYIYGRTFTNTTWTAENVYSSMTSLFAHTVAQPTKWRFLPKNLSQLVIFVIGLAFTWV